MIIRQAHLSYDSLKIKLRLQSPKHPQTVAMDFHTSSSEALLC